MQDHYKAILEERLNYLLTKRTVCYAELDTGGKRIECPNCHVQIIPTLGKNIIRSIFLLTFSLLQKSFFFELFCNTFDLVITTGNWISDKFPCKSCKANLCFRNSTAKTARCPCRNISRPVPSMCS